MYGYLNIKKENIMSNDSVVQAIINKTKGSENDTQKIYRLYWASGHNNVVSLDEAVETINRFANQSNWQWIRIVNTETNNQQIVYESKAQVGKALNTLNKDMI